MGARIESLRFSLMLTTPTVVAAGAAKFFALSSKYEGRDASNVGSAGYGQSDLIVWV